MLTQVGDMSGHIGRIDAQNEFRQFERLRLLFLIFSDFTLLVGFGSLLYRLLFLLFRMSLLDMSRSLINQMVKYEKAVSAAATRSAQSHVCGAG